MSVAAPFPIRRADRIGIALQKVLECVNAAAEQNQVTLPKRQYITTGAAVYDCEEVVVALQEMTIGAIDFEFDPFSCTAASAPKKIAVTVSIVRCLQIVTESGSAISPKKITEKTLNYTRDGWVLMDMLACVGDHVVGTVTFEGPESGAVATTVNFEMQT